MDGFYSQRTSNFRGRYIVGLFRGIECLYVAQFLSGQTNGPCTRESVQRAAINRVYYAAYGHAFHHEVDNGRFEPTRDRKKRGQDHWRLRNHFAKDLKDNDTATKLEELSMWRKMCDYDKVVMEPMPISKMLEKAEHIISALR